MKRSTAIVTKNYLRLLGRLALLVAQYLGLGGFSELAGGIETKANIGAGRKLFGGLIVNDPNRPRSDEYQRGGGHRRIAVLPS
ncbi:MAG: hypothetical protein ACFB14_18540 [Leptolyngbyaceae cyanobacterium]